MKIKIIKNNETVLDADMPKSLNDEQEKELRQHEGSEIISYSIEFNEGTIMKDVSDISEISPEVLKQITIYLK